MLTAKILLVGAVLHMVLKPFATFVSFTSKQEIGLSVLIVFVVDKNANCKGFAFWGCAPHGTESQEMATKSEAGF